MKFLQCENKYISNGIGIFRCHSSLWSSRRIAINFTIPPTTITIVIRYGWMYSCQYATFQFTLILSLCFYCDLIYKNRLLREKKKNIQTECFLKLAEDWGINNKYNILPLYGNNRNHNFFILKFIFVFS